ncbi:MAG: M4 family metallopeptidase [Aureibaculum sp.]|nr:M4 family metallopeptidase [Aureibaculum sp.]
MKKMIKNYFYQILLFFVLNLPFIVVGQINNDDAKSYQKTIKLSSSINIEEAKTGFIKEFGLDNNSTFFEYQSNTDKRGGIHQKFQQYYNGIKVEYGTMIVHSKNGMVSSINGELYNPEGINLSSALTPTVAFQKAITHVDAKTYLWSDTERSKMNDYKKPEGELIIFPIIGEETVELTLAYKFDIYATDPVSRGYVFIDAKNGEFLYNEPIIKHFNNSDTKVSTRHVLSDKAQSSKSNIMLTGTADTRYSGNRSIETRSEVNGTFTLNDESRNVHTYNAQNSPTNGTYQFTTVDFADNDNNWTAAEYDNAARDNAALDAHWGAMNVFDFWANLGRNSINGFGMEIRSYVHVGTDYFNAFWNGSVMSYGDGTPNPLTSIDIVAHEMAHGVTTWTADLVYARESGAMNEAFSDIFGAAIEFFAKGTGTDTNPNAETWLLAEEFWPSGYLRSMSDPKSKGDPDTYNGTNYTDATNTCIPSNTNDYCGVHSNSGVLNHWFYILVSGKSGTNDVGDTYNVTGIGMTKAQEIAYLTLRDYLSPNSSFMDARNGAIEVASNLYGSNSAERKATQDAFYAVNVGDDPFTPFPTDLKLVEFSELTDITCGETIIPKIIVRNSGASNTINTIQVSYTIDGVAQTPFNWNGTLAIDGETEISLPNINESAIKSYNLVVETVVSGDGDPSNNSISSAFRVNKSDDTPTQVNPFDFFFQNWLNYNEGDPSNLWVIGMPNKTNLNTVTSGDAAYVTGTTANYPNETKSYLISPCYDLTTLINPKLKFNMAFELEENFDIIYVEYSIDAINWTILGSATNPNWYNSDRIFESGEISTDCQNCPGAQWTGSSNVFTEYSYDLSSFTSEPKINFRFVFHSNASGNDEGVVIDDFVIEEAALAVNDFDILSQSVLIYPNPSKDVFTISWDSGSDIDIELFDLTGKKILSKKNIVGRSNKYELDMSEFSKGFYFAKIKIGKGSVTKKIILQ